MVRINGMTYIWKEGNEIDEKTEEKKEEGKMQEEMRKWHTPHSTQWHWRHRNECSPWDDWMHSAKCKKTQRRIERKNKMHIHWEVLYKMSCSESRNGACSRKVSRSQQNYWKWNSRDGDRVEWHETGHTHYHILGDIISLPHIEMD